MKRSRFTEEKIIGILKEADGETPTKATRESDITIVGMAHEPVTRRRRIPRTLEQIRELYTQ